MKKPNNVFLIGPMGVGKSTIGRMLAQSLGRPFLDSDREIEAVTGADIPWIFDVEGEPGFRVREERMIDSLTQQDGIVMATGGGAILSEATRRRLQSRGVVVYLKASIAQQFERTSKDRNRPLLQTADPLGRIKELMRVREPLYLETADLIVETSRRGPRNVVNEIVKRLQQLDASQRSTGENKESSHD
ncbi:shikimate kinase AroK [Pseudohongiella spirulinae]|uniref:Shikimate kinase n=1 Tax=Pseudohongiella spirulinae TaxID=1249552 RepID=A0A0S2KH87_9GAMM|nr:shikimate kinase AroK [Pseudohongiella spirulinae]ALO47314.1 shikimate kinase [Pseudohongiella spirulinae]